MTKMTFTNPQTAFEYAIYMIVGSCFDKTHCQNQLIEKSMKLQYAEQKLDTQYRMEEACIDFVDSILLKQLPEKFWEQEADVRMVKQPSKGTTVIQFITSNNIIVLKGVYKGKKSEIKYTIYDTEPECA